MHNKIVLLIGCISWYVYPCVRVYITVPDVDTCQKMVRVFDALEGKLVHHAAHLQKIERIAAQSRLHAIALWARGPETTNYMQQPFPDTHVADELIAHHVWYPGQNTVLLARQIADVRAVKYFLVQMIAHNLCGTQIGMDTTQVLEMDVLLDEARDWEPTLAAAGYTPSEIADILQTWYVAITYIRKNPISCEL